MSRAVIGVAGFKNSGKTTLVERLVAELVRRGFAVSTIKHAHHAFDIDHEGRDSYRHRQAGASQVAVVSGARWAVMRELRGAPEPSLNEMLERLEPCDLVVVEGYKGGNHAKIEVRAPDSTQPVLAQEDRTIFAIAADQPVDGVDVPVVARDDVGGLTDLVCVACGLNRAG